MNLGSLSRKTRDFFIFITVHFCYNMSMSWNSRRQLMYGSIVVVFLLVVAGVPAYFTFFNNAPTCFDGVQNQNETGIDCGGACERACLVDVIPLPVTIWSRAFSVKNGYYNLVAYVQNANVEYVAEPTKYIFRVYDKDNVLIGVREGYADVPPTKTFPIFEQGFNAGERIPVSTYFEFVRGVPWKKYEGTKPELKVVDQKLSIGTSGPRIDAKLVNVTINRYKNIEVIAIVYDQAGNAMGSSRTYVDELGSSAESSLVFTWPQPFPSVVSRFEIVPKLPTSLTL